MKSLIFSILKYLLLPFALLYGMIVWLRNKFYDWKIFSSIGFSLPVICVGNITVGGTGKSPHIEYLIELLSPLYQVATLSRGYRRHSRGFRIANEQSNAKDIGDEPFQFHSKYPQVTVAVAEERMTAIPSLLQQRPATDIILLDDAFQHRSVIAGFNILLTDIGRLYTNDAIMPFGLLREGRSAARRAQMIVVTKCPTGMGEAERQRIIQEIAPQSDQHIYFSGIQYKNIYSLSGNTPLTADTAVLLVTGIANADPLLQHLKSRFAEVFHLPYKDHHYFRYDDLEEIKAAFDHIKAEKKVIITTEKDAARLMLLKDKILEYQLPFYAQAIGVEILFDQTAQFNAEILTFVHSIIPPILEEPLNDLSAPQE